MAGSRDAADGLGRQFRGASNLCRGAGLDRVAALQASQRLCLEHGARTRAQDLCAAHHPLSTKETGRTGRGGTVVGAGKPGFSPGTVIPPHVWTCAATDAAGCKDAWFRRHGGETNEV
jgi:hypothetical protein